MSDVVISETLNIDILEKKMDGTFIKKNPSTTKAQVGLGNVDNTSDANKPISIATGNAIDLKANTTYVNTELNKKATSVDLVAHTGSRANPHVVTKAQVGLGSVDNTTDAGKPVSNATQTALNLKANDSAVVHKSGTETITGVKNFTNSVNIGTTSVPNQLSVKGSLIVDGDIIQNGGSYETQVETIRSTNDKVVLRDGAVGGLGVGQTAGFVFTKYDGTNNGELSVDSSGTARVGDVGDLQPLATRKEAGDMVNNGVVVWESSTLAMKTRALTATDIPSIPASKITSGTLAVARIPTIPISGVDGLQNELNGKTSATDVTGIITPITNALANSKVDKNPPITAGTKGKITYDAKGLVTGGSNLIESDIPMLSVGKVTGLTQTLTTKADKVYVDGIRTVTSPVQPALEAGGQWHRVV